jgi:hypothetical protein
MLSHDYDAEVRTYNTRTREDLQYLVGLGAGSDVVVFGGRLKEQIPNAAADEKCLVPVGLESAENLQSGIVHGYSTSVAFSQIDIFDGTQKYFHMRGVIESTNIGNGSLENPNKSFVNSLRKNVHEDSST